MKSVYLKTPYKVLTFKQVNKKKAPLQMAENNLQAATMLRSRANDMARAAQDEKSKTQKFQRNDSLKKKAVDGTVSQISGLEPEHLGSKISS